VETVSKHRSASPKNEGSKASEKIIEREQALLKGIDNEEA